MTPEEIPGWFDWPALYDRVAASLWPGALVVEVGCWHGRSLAHLGESVRGRGVTVFGVDLCLPTNETEGCNVGPLVANLHALGLYPDPVRLMVMPSLDAARLFPARSIDCVFIDAAHDEHSVFADIMAWRPKVRSGGILAGHDYRNPHWPGVEAAVSRVFGTGDFTAAGCPSCWEVRKS